MTVNTEKSYQKYIGNGETKVFNIPFSFVDEEIIVFKGDTLNAYEKVVDYNISYDDIVFNAAPAEGDTLYIARKVVLKQLVDFIEGENFPAENYEYSLDHIVYALQELSMWVDQAWKSPLGTTPDDAMDKLIKSYIGDNVTERLQNIDEQIERLFSLLEQASNNFQNYYTKSEIDDKIGDIDSILDTINGEVI